MIMHFYTHFRNIEKIEKGEVTQVWNENESMNGDIEISLDYDDYNVFRTPNNNVFEVGKKVWISK